MPSRPVPRILISAPAKSSGKTTVTLGLIRSLVRRGLKVQAFKKGPDFIDPMWHTQASGRPGRNLDPWMMEPERILESLDRHSLGVDLVVIEGNHGLHDGLDLEGRYSTAGLASQLGTPVVLVVDSRGLNRGVAAQVLGQLAMAPKVELAGVILNRVKSERQGAKLVASLEYHTGAKVLGVLGEEPAAGIEERHLGLTTHEETQGAQAKIEAAADWLSRGLDLEAVLAAAQGAAALEFPQWEPAQPWAGEKLPLGVLRNEAFCFYYPENLEALEQAGAELLFLDPIRDREIPALAGLYIGGGFPESFLPQLEANRSFRAELKARLQAGLPYWAECGGLIYLAQSASFDGSTRYEGVGWIPGQIDFSKRPVGFGYMELTPQKPHWLSGPLKAHEFHYSKLTALDPSLPKLFALQKGAGLGGQEDGLLLGQGLAGYAHLHALAVPAWAPGFLDQIRNLRFR